MAVDTNTKPQRLLSRRLSIGFALAAAALGAVALYRTNPIHAQMMRQFLQISSGLRPK